MIMKSNVTYISNYLENKYHRFARLNSLENSLVYNINSIENPIYLGIKSLNEDESKFKYDFFLEEEVMKINTSKNSFRDELNSNSYNRFLLNLPHIGEDSLNIITNNYSKSYLFFTKNKINNQYFSSRITQVFVSPQEIILNWLSRLNINQIFSKSILLKSRFGSDFRIETLRGNQEIKKYLQRNGINSFFEEIGRNKFKPLDFLNN